MQTFCALTGTRVPRGEACPVHHTADCLMRGWLTEVPDGKRPTPWARLRRALRR